MDAVMMKCGHAANATTKRDGEDVPCCAICAICANDDAVTVVQGPDLTGRSMRCGYDRGSGCVKRGGQSSVVASNMAAAFFEFKGDGSAWALRCRRCNCTPAQHEDGTARNRRVRCSSYEPVGPAEFDAYYCGCWGWD